MDGPVVSRERDGESLPSWVFTWDEAKRQFTHMTRKGTEYRIVIGGDSYKPIWIARVFKGIKSETLVSYEEKIFAVEIEFQDGAKFIFP